MGQAITLREGKDLTIVAAGIMVHEALQAAQTLAEEGIQAEVIDMFTIKPWMKRPCWPAPKTGAVLVTENHNKIGGFHAAVLRSPVQGVSTPATASPSTTKYGEGPQDYLQKRFGLTAENIVATAKNC